MTLHLHAETILDVSVSMILDGFSGCELPHFGCHVVWKSKIKS